MIRVRVTREMEGLAGYHTARIRFEELCARKADSFSNRWVQMTRCKADDLMSSQAAARSVMDIGFLRPAFATRLCVATDPFALAHGGRLWLLRWQLNLAIAGLHLPE